MTKQAYVRDLLSAYGYPGEQVPVVRVSALAALAGEERWVASILDLLDAIDAYVPVPDRYLDAPFLMAVENCMTITGRGTPVRSGYRPQFYLRTTDVCGELDLGAGAVAPAMPGQTVQVTVALGKPVALDPGQTFAIREGGRTVGAGTVAALLD